MKLEVRGDAEPGHGIAGRWRRIQGVLSGSLERLARNGYRPALERALEWRYATLAAGHQRAPDRALRGRRPAGMKFNFFPEVESDYVSARLTMPQGTPVGDDRRRRARSSRRRRGA